MSTYTRGNEDVSTRSVVISWADPEPSAARAASMTGIERLRAWAAGELPLPPSAALIEGRLVEVEEGRVRYEIVPAEQHTNLYGTVHGGMLTAILDTVMALAVGSLLPAAVGLTTLELKVNFVRPVTLDSGPLCSSANVLHPGKRVMLAEGRMEDNRGRLVAHATSTCMIFGAGPD
jgi:uncharacterized protein (TIGR00369 family)